MKKADLVESMAKSAGITKTEATKALDALTDMVARSLRDGEKVTLVGFGTFSVSRRKARTGRNPQTGRPIHIAAKKVPKFAAGRDLKTAARMSGRGRPNGPPGRKLRGTMVRHKT